MADLPPRSIDAGIYNVARPTYSASTMKLLKVLMEETKVPKLQQRIFQESLRSGQPFPLTARTAKVRPQRGPAPAAPRVSDTWGKRTRETIQSLEGDQAAHFRPPPGRDREAERERLALMMTHGREALDLPLEKDQQRQEEQTPSRFDELWAEVEERRQFLEEMRRLGRGREYEPIIRGELARLVQEMEQLQRDGGGAPLQEGKQE